jgi:hypothetical protein
MKKYRDWTWYHNSYLIKIFLFHISSVLLQVKVDDYRSERSETLNAQGPKFSFSFGDYVAKALVGN